MKLIIVGKINHFIIYRYKFYYEDENDLTFLCIGENLETDVAFSYLDDVKKAFLTTYNIKEVLQSFSYQYKDFSKQIKRIATSYELNPTSKIKVLKNKLSETSTVLKENVEKLIQKGEKINIIAQKSRNLTESSDTFLKNIKEIKKRQKLKRIKYIAIVSLVLILVIFIIWKMIF